MAEEQKTKHIEMNWEVDENDLHRTEEMYRQWVPSFFGTERKLILPLIRILRIGQQNNKPRLLLDLVDIFSRERIRHYTKQEKVLSIKEWVNTDKYVASIIKGKQSKQPPKQLIQEAMESFFKRSHAKIRFHSFEKINDVLEPFALYVQEAVNFIQFLLKDIPPVIPPFQIDLMIIPAAIVKEIESDDESEEDDSDNDDNDEKKDASIMSDNFDVKDCLIKSKCIFQEQILKQDSPRMSFMDVYKQFQLNHKKDNSLHKKRICIIADRRQNKIKDANDILYIYVPPKGNEISGNVPETFIQTSSECVLPRPQSDDPITSRTADSGFFMLSFHVVQQDVIKCYLYQRHQICRFFPSDIMNLWPCLFQMENDKNKGYDKGNFNDLLKTLVISDCEFDKVYTSNELVRNVNDNDKSLIGLINWLKNHESTVKYPLHYKVFEDTLQKQFDDDDLNVNDIVDDLEDEDNSTFISAMKNDANCSSNYKQYVQELITALNSYKQ
eukprot:127723_1